MMDQTEPASLDAAPSRGATIHPLRPMRKTNLQFGAPEDRIPLEMAGDVVAQAMCTLLRLELGGSGRSASAVRGLATSLELSRMIDTFLSIRDAERRRYCLAVVRSCAMADAEERGHAG